MNNVSFLIALQIDSPDRISNLDTSIDNLLYHFPDCDIVIAELDCTSKIKDRYPKCNHIFVKTDEFFNKQRAYNIAANNAKHQVIALYDADIILDPRVVQKSIELIADKHKDIVWPYDGKFYDVPKRFHQEIKETKSLKSIKVEECVLFSSQAVGGVVFFDKDVFWEGGGGNENFKGAGWEDNEIYVRYTKLGYKRVKIDVPMFHLNHERKETSYNYNPYGKFNEAEFVRIDRMNTEQLLDEIKTWNYKK